MEVQAEVSESGTGGVPVAFDLRGEQPDSPWVSGHIAVREQRSSFFKLLIGS
jgi:hypothetical protein